ncbi:MAG: hypothetical protein EA378_09935 [Phycisphaerales bacterium]|nr:MAG: hypothetical protein EA378_09935 [Phycisphaerales bacterium]
MSAPSGSMGVGVEPVGVEPVRVEVASVPPASSRALSPADLAELLGAFHDVTSQLQSTHATLHAEVARLRGELSEANERLQRSRRLAALGEMAAGIAHEVRNPLGSIRLYAEMLIADLASMPEQRACAGKIASAVRAADAIVTDVLHFAREVRVQSRACEAGVLFARALDACRDLCVGVEIGGGLGEGVECWCDPHLTHQALVNVVRNGLEAAAEGEVAPRRLTLDAEVRTDADGRDEVALVVRDSGPGVTRDVIDRMFNPFFTTRATGTGLGLSIVHRIADAHGGRVEVRNNAEDEAGARGARFEIVLPAVEPAAHE